MFRFTIRDVLWLTVVVGLSLGLWLEHRHSSELREQLQRAWWWHGPGWRTGESEEVDWSVLGAEDNSGPFNPPLPAVAGWNERLTLPPLFRALAVA
jgi:hypothetical protein